MMEEDGPYFWLLPLYEQLQGLVAMKALVKHVITHEKERYQWTQTAPAKHFHRKGIIPLFLTLCF